MPQRSKQVEKRRGANVLQVLLGSMILGIVVLAAVLFIRQPGIGLALIPQRGSTATAAAGQHKQLYQSTMHPWVVQDHPGTCPICGMELVPMDADSQAAWEKNHPSA
jgi:Cu(I)/Ag(I) efflux system membrane fusion protein